MLVAVLRNKCNVPLVLFGLKKSWSWVNAQVKITANVEDFNCCIIENSNDEAQKAEAYSLQSKRKIPIKRIDWNVEVYCERIQPSISMDSSAINRNETHATTHME